MGKSAPHSIDQESTLDNSTDDTTRFSIDAPETIGSAGRQAMGMILRDIFAQTRKPGDYFTEGDYEDVDKKIRRPAVREAIAALTFGGFLRCEEGGKRRVRVVLPTEQNVIAAVNYRKEQEGAAVRILARAGIMPNQIWQLEQAIEQMELGRNKGDHLMFNGADGQFHGLLLEFAFGEIGCPSYWRYLCFVLFAHQAAQGGVKDQDEVIDEHRRILEALCAPDSKENDPEKRVKYHLDKTLERIGLGVSGRFRGRAEHAGSWAIDSLPTF